MSLIYIFILYLLYLLAICFQCSVSLQRNLNKSLLSIIVN